ncbi:MAG: PAS domain-containing protein [Clostridiales bacterium]
MLKYKEEKEEMENQIKLSEMRLKIATDSAKIGLWEWNVITGEIVFNSYWAEILGYKLEELEPVSINTWENLTHPDDLKKSDKMIKKCFDKEIDYYKCEIRMKHKKGYWLWILDKGRVIEWDKDNKPLKMAGVHIDIGYLKKIEEELREERKLFMGGPTIVCLLKNQKGLPLEYISPNIKKLIGYDSNELIEKEFKFINLIHPEDLMRINKEVEYFIKKNVLFFEQEFRLIDIKGKIRWFWNFTVIKKNDENEITHFHGYLTDITKRRHIEEELIKAKKLAETANRMKSRFLANMSHEIRTPMNGIIGFLDILNNTELSEIQKDYIKEVKSASETLLHLINDLLDFSKIEAGKMNFENIEFNLYDVLYDTVKLLMPKADEKKLDLNLFIDSDVPDRVFGDFSRLKQILNNLIGNAIKFTINGDVTIYVKAVNIDGLNYKIEFRISDTGIGIKQTDIAKLFKPFSQLDSSTTRKYGGTGLGLAISNQLVKRMGGDTIKVESQLNEGSDFYFSIRTEVRNLDIVETTQKILIEEMELLIVDDNYKSREIIKCYLGGYNMNISEADSGNEAIEIINQKVEENRKFNAIIIDYKMPYMNGIELSKIIRSIPSTRDTNLLLMMTYTQKNDIKTMEDNNLISILMKPLKKLELIKSIEKLSNKTKE